MLGVSVEPSRAAGLVINNTSNRGKGEQKLRPPGLQRQDTSVSVVGRDRGSGRAVKNHADGDTMVAQLFFLSWKGFTCMMADFGVDPTGHLCRAALLSLHPPVAKTRASLTHTLSRPEFLGVCVCVRVRVCRPCVLSCEGVLYGCDWNLLLKATWS
jgi:hypothetical protein